ncbi:MAG: hypothetical protein ABI606_03830 [Rhodoferax sp.]
MALAHQHGLTEGLDTIDLEDARAMLGCCQFVRPSAMASWVLNPQVFVCIASA